MKIQLRIADAMDPDNPNSDFNLNDSDREDASRRSVFSNRRVIVFAFSGNRYNRFNISIITKTFIAQKSNNKYPDVENFHGIDKNKHIWDF